VSHASSLSKRKIKEKRKENQYKIRKIKEKKNKIVSVQVSYNNSYSKIIRCDNYYVLVTHVVVTITTSCDISKG